MLRLPGRGRPPAREARAAGECFLALACLALLAVSPLPAAAGDPPAYASRLIAEARDRSLAAHPVWLALLHFEPTFFRATPASLADSPDFFLDPDGWHDAGAEMAATIAAFFADADADVRERGHPQCVFRARYLWLAGQLDFDPELLPPRPCPDFDAWRQAIDPVSVTLVFPEAYMNNPSSMFGHTLLRFDAVRDGERRDLLAYAANFSADPGEDNVVVFAWRGIVGGYAGRFNLEPYYEKVAEYADWEQRDLWEYELTLEQAEIDFILAHLWELRGVVFEYFFFDENCSYQLLGLLRVARPDLVYWHRFQLWAAPADTVRAVVHDSGLLRAVAFRPSATTVLRQEAALLSPDDRRLAIAIARGDASLDDARLAALDDDRRAIVLTVAHDVLRHSFLSREVERQPAAERARLILLALSRIPHREALLPPVPAPAIRPDEGHGTARLATGAGWRRSRPFVELQARPSFHDLTDPQGGYVAGAQIEFLATTLRVYGDDGEVRLQDFTLVDVVSLAPRDDLFQPISWRAGTRVLSLLVPGEGGDSGIPGLVDRYAWRTSGGPGLAYDLPWELLGYGFLLADVDVSGALRNSVSAGGGAAVGLFRSFAADRTRTHLLAEVIEFALGQQHTQARWALAQRLTLGRQSALFFELAATRDYDRTWVEGALRWQWFF